jgi:hypothetical protein
MPSVFTRKVSSGIGTTATAVGSYTVPTGTTATAIGLSVANTSANQVTVDVALYNGTTDFFILKNVPVAAGASVLPIGGGQKVVLAAGDSIRIDSSAAASVDAILSLLEIS